MLRDKEARGCIDINLIIDYWMQVLNAEAKTRNADRAFSASLARGASALTDMGLTFHIFEHVRYRHVTGPLKTLQLSSASW